MTWLQENWIIAVVGLVVAVGLLWALFGRKKPEAIAPPVEPAKPAKPLEPVKPEIIAAEPARFKPIAPAPQPLAPVPPAVEPVAVAPAPIPAPSPAPTPVTKPKPAPIPAPAEEAPPPAPKPKPKAKAAPKAKPVVAPEPATAAPQHEAVPAALPKAAPPAAKADNLQLLKGLGPKMVVLLNGLGVSRFQQIADWTEAEIAAIDSQLGAFQGRIARDNLVDQAGYLARGDKAGFEAKYGALGGEL